MTRRLLAPMLTCLVALVLLGVTTGPALTSYTDVPVVSPTEGRQALDNQIAEECGGLTFEDLFVYDFALFELKVHDDWATGEMSANAWVNGSNSATVRDNLDGLFDGLPGGNNSWISTDERDAVRNALHGLRVRHADCRLRRRSLPFVLGTRSSLPCRVQH